jgi:uncharacterized membrane protein YphA (DoxX/SURF4 family)
MEQKNKTLLIALWIVQGLLAAMFLMAGFMKSFTPIEELAGSLPWVKEYSPALVRFIGVSELLGALGLILPSLLRIKPQLTPLAALGILIIMVLAAGFHLMRSEYETIPVNVIIGALALLVAWGRYKKLPIQPKV